MQLTALFREANDATIAARAAGLDARPDPVAEQFATRDDTVLADGGSVHPRRLPPGTRRRVEQTPADNLVARLSTNTDEALKLIIDRHPVFAMAFQAQPPIPRLA
jgi:transposase